MSDSANKINFIFGYKPEVLIAAEKLALPVPNFSLRPVLEKGKKAESGPCYWMLLSPPDTSYEVFVQSSFVQPDITEVKCNLADVIPIRRNNIPELGGFALGLAGGA